MTAPVNLFKQALREGRPQIGLWQALASPYTVEICAGAGFDWLLLDGEHGPNDVPMLLSQLQAVAPYSSHPVGRPPIGQTWIVKQYLDIGLTTLLIPLVDTAEHAAEMVKAVRYPPRGTRGIGAALVRAARWNRTPGYLNDADDQICLLLQVETVEGLRNLDAIATTEGVDGVFIGPSDLSGSMGHRGNPGHPEVQAAIEAAVARVKKAGKAPGILAADETMAKHYLSLGCLFVAVGSDVALLARGSNELLRRFKDLSVAERPSGY
ncbi:MAG: 4-hydroxy-2-oxoheptanedioate aldolase [Alphaproteobacteria bacterium]|nr:4-hydroxy-2-oxoheptanedioate aldolase [Alphaproteobacteria bacterium]MDE2495904.1 4-hydroxy-2-oxoheptanedioate aldolase [Alphaproteobacteria bacterium]